MREIKFRAWDKRRGKFHWGIANLCLSLGGHLMWQFGDRAPDILSLEEAADYVLEQFTGQHDAKGKDIYEGDRVGKDGATFVVAMNEGAACWYLWDSISQQWDITLAQAIRWGYSVIGNVHEEEAPAMKGEA